MVVSRMIRRIVEKSGKSALVVDHDVYFIDMVSDGLIVFEGTSGRHGVANGPYSLHEGMNRFLRDVDITFRRDEETQRPRVNKPDSYIERQQKESGEYVLQTLDASLLKNITCDIITNDISNERPRDHRHLFSYTTRFLA